MLKAMPRGTCIQTTVAGVKALARRSCTQAGGAGHRSSRLQGVMHSDMCAVRVQRMASVQKTLQAAANMWLKQASAPSSCTSGSDTNQKQLDLLPIPVHVLSDGGV